MMGISMYIIVDFYWVYGNWQVHPTQMAKYQAHLMRKIKKKNKNKKYPFFLLYIYIYKLKFQEKMVASLPNIVQKTI